MTIFGKRGALTAYHFSCPVFHIGIAETGVVSLKGDIRGTAFPISGKHMVTAGHVASGFSTRAEEVTGVGIVGPDGRFKTAIVRRWEVLPGDVAILELEHLAKDSEGWLRLIRWTRRGLVGLEQVRAIGYAYGLQVTDDGRSIISRAFEGGLVARNNRFTLLGSDQPAFEVYELPFQAPRGLSGSPLLSSTGKILVHGVIIGNSQSKMKVLSTEEVVVETNTTTRVEQYDTMQLGIATQGPWLLEQHSELLGGTLGNHLSRTKLLE